MSLITPHASPVPGQKGLPYEHSLPCPLTTPVHRPPVRFSTRYVPRATSCPSDLLHATRHKETAYEEVEYDPPKVILQRMRELEDEIRKDLDELERML